MSDDLRIQTGSVSPAGVTQKTSQGNSQFLDEGFSLYGYNLLDIDADLEYVFLDTTWKRVRLKTAYADIASRTSIILSSGNIGTYFNFVAPAGSGGTITSNALALTGDQLTSSVNGVTSNAVTLPTGGGGSTTLTATQIAYGSGTNTVTSNAGFRWDPSNFRVLLQDAADDAALGAGVGKMKITSKITGELLSEQTAIDLNANAGAAKRGTGKRYRLTHTGVAVSTAADNVPAGIAAGANTDYFSGFGYGTNANVNEYSVIASNMGDSLRMNPVGNILQKNTAAALYTSYKQLPNGDETKFIEQGIANTATADGDLTNYQTFTRVGTSATTANNKDHVFINKAVGSNWLFRNGIAVPIRTVTGATTTTKDDGVVVVNNSANIATTLHSAVTCPGMILTIKKSAASGTNTNTLTPNGAQTIDGAATLVQNTAGQSTMLISDGANWIVI